MDEKNKKAKRVAAIICIVLLVSMYIVSFIVALCTDASSFGLFMACIFSTIFIPILVFLAIELYKLVNKNTKGRVSVKQVKKLSREHENDPEGMINELEKIGARNPENEESLNERK